MITKIEKEKSKATEQNPKELQKVAVDKRKLSDRAKSLIMELTDPKDADNKNKSALVFRAVMELCRKGFSVEEIYSSVMIDGSEMSKYLYMSKRTEKAIQEEITRCYEKSQKLLEEKRKAVAKKAEIIGYNSKHEVVYRKDGNILSIAINKLNADILHLMSGIRPDGEEELSELKQGLINRCNERGLVFEDQILKEGIWHHDGEFLLISKDSALLVGEDKSYKDFREPTYHKKILDHKNSTAWYDRELLVNLPPDVTLGTVFEQVLATTRRFNWKHPETADYTAAMVMLAPFQNALEWVPWVYIAGASSTGKSTYIQDFFSNLYPGLLNHLGKTTAHAIAQEIGNTGRIPVLDEFEKSGRIPEILELAKTANRGGYKTSGTPGAYSLRYQLKHMFWFASIYVSLHDEAQKNRALVFELDRVKKAQREFHLPGKAELKQLGTKSVGVLLKRWQDIEERRKQVKNRYTDLDARMKDTLMYPIALLELAEEERTGKSVTKSPPVFAYTPPEHEEEKILDDILTSDIWIHTDTTTKTTVFEALMSFGTCKTALNDVGITRTKSNGKEYLALHPPVVRRKLLNDMKEYAYNDVKEPLSRFEGAKKGNPTKIGRKTQKCVLIPWETIETIYKIAEDGSSIRKKPLYKKIEKKEP